MPRVTFLRLADLELSGFRPVPSAKLAKTSLVKPKGDYLLVRANALENNLVLFKYEKGKRSSVEWIRDTPTPSGQWQDLKVRISGAKVEGYLNGKLYLTHTLPMPVSGKIGVWSKADSVVYFDDYRVVPAPQG